MVSGKAFLLTRCANEVFLGAIASSKEKTLKQIFKKRLVINAWTNLIG